MEKNSYSRVDRFLHRLAFKIWPLQALLSDVEDKFFERDLKKIEINNPVFVTGLPRAGTTLVLNLLASAGGFSAHSYRDMPFLLVPLMWSYLSARFRVGAVLKERAHADGVLVSIDSPEAFEEVVWRLFWPVQYEIDRVVPWGGRVSKSFAIFMTNHMKKIILLRRSDSFIESRYVSKNNTNIARIESIKKIYPTSRVVILFRKPLEHASSLLRLHRKFSEMHSRDPFSREYMEAIGHYDFGENLRPINFGNWLDYTKHKEPFCLNFWLNYWLAAYGKLLETNEQDVYFFSYDKLCEDPASSLDVLAKIVGVDSMERLMPDNLDIHAPKMNDTIDDSIDQDLCSMAEEIYGRLLVRSQMVG